jgi:diguanylate cyclase (GGDEF)-like protein
MERIGLDKQGSGNMSNYFILCVDDDITLLKALRTLLCKHLGQGYVVDVAESGEEALEIQAELAGQGNELCVVISDYIMPGMHGDELLVKMHQLSPKTMKILLTGQSELDGVKRTINDANLYRFLEKPFNNDDIVLTVRTAVRAYAQQCALELQNMELRQINATLEQLVEARTAELKEKNLELERLSVTDKLTGLFNRLKLDQILEQQLIHSQRYNACFALILLDIDKFKAVNDQFGHQAGDQVLCAIAQILRQCSRASDLVGRWGGEEFLIVLTETKEGAMVLAEKLRQTVEQYDFPVTGHKTASFGVTVYRNGDTIEGMMARVDAALYCAKNSGRNRVEFGQGEQ